MQSFWLNFYGETFLTMMIIKQYMEFDHQHECRFGVIWGIQDEVVLNLDSTICKTLFCYNTVTS